MLGILRRTPILTLVMLLSLAVGFGRTQAQGADLWEARFNHTLGISFRLPLGYDLVASTVLTYSDGDNIVQFDAQPSRRIHRRTLDEACSRLAGDAPGYAYEIVNGGQQNICLYTSRTQEAPFTSIIADTSRETPGGQRYDYLLLQAPEADLLAITESIAFEDEVSASLYLGEALRMVRANFVYAESVDWEALYSSALASVDQFSSLADARSVLREAFTTLNAISAHDAQIVSPDEATYTGGYGFESERLAGDAFLTVTLIYPNSPADEAGLEVGDQIHAINGDTVDSAAPRTGNETLRLDVLRPDSGGSFRLRLDPGFYNPSLEVSGRDLPEHIGYIETYSAGVIGGGFDYSDAAQRLIRDIDREAMCGWIVDVRRNPGGQALVMSLALAPLRGDGRWFGLKDIRGEISWYTYDFDGFPEIAGQLHISDPYQVKTANPPVAVLVSPYTASMGEMTAYIFKSRTNATTRIFGEATSGYLRDGLSIVPLFDGSIMDIVSDVSITPDGDPLPAYIEPDEVILTDYTVYGTDSDPVILAAKAWLSQQPECLTQQQASNPQIGEIRFVATSGGVVNIRSGPSTVSAILTMLPNGTRLEVVERSTDGAWLRVRFEGGEGWIFAALTRPSASMQKQ